MVFLGAETSFFSLTRVPHSSAMLLAGTQIRSGRTAGVVLGFGGLPG
jgi:hypothetical protein